MTIVFPEGIPKSTLRALLGKPFCMAHFIPSKDLKNPTNIQLNGPDFSEPIPAVDAPWRRPSLDDLDLRILRAFRDYPEISWPPRSRTAI